MKKILLFTTALFFYIISFSQSNIENVIKRFREMDHSKIETNPFAKKLKMLNNAQGLKADGDSDPCTAVTLSGPTLDGTTCVTGDNTGAGGFFAALGCDAGFPNGNEIFFKFTATEESINITVNDLTMTGGGPSITIMEDRNNDCAGTPDWWELNNSCPTFGTLVNFQQALTIGNEYYLAIDSDRSNDEGTFELCVEQYEYIPPPPAAGGDCSSATVLTGNLPFSTTSSTTAAMNDVWTNNCLLGDGLAVYNMYDQWYEYTSPGDEYLNINLTNILPNTTGNANEDLLTMVSMIQSSCPLPAANGEEDLCLNSSDQTNDGGEQNSDGSLIHVLSTTNGDFIPPCKTVYIENPGTYYFIVEGVQLACLGFPMCTWTIMGSELTSYDLDISVMAQGPNDECGSPDSLFLNITESGNNAGCNYSWDEEDPDSDQMCATTTENTAWFQFCTDASSTDVDIDFANVTGSIQWGVVQGACGGAMTSAGTNAANPGIYVPGPNGGIGLSGAGDPCYVGNSDHQITITGLTPSTCYWIVVDGSSGTPSSFDVTITGGVTLGLDFLNVKGSQKYSTNIIEWGTENNSSTSKFEILRSTNNKSFDVIGSINASETSISQYTYVDEKIILGKTYYYLIKRIDKNGESFTSKVVKIGTTKSINDLSKVVVSGNDLSFDLSSVTNTISKIQIYDMSGKIIFEKNETLNEGENHLEVNMGSISNGTYLLFITSNDERLYQKFVK